MLLLVLLDDRLEQGAKLCPLTQEGALAPHESRHLALVGVEVVELIVVEADSVDEHHLELASAAEIRPYLARYVAAGEGIGDDVVGRAQRHEDATSIAEVPCSQGALPGLVGGLDAAEIVLHRLVDDRSLDRITHAP